MFAGRDGSWSWAVRAVENGTCGESRDTSCGVWRVACGVWLFVALCGFVWHPLAGTEVRKDVEVVGRGLFNKECPCVGLQELNKNK
jgi:hypothetical protein